MSSNNDLVIAQIQKDAISFKETFDIDSYFQNLSEINNYLKNDEKCPAGFESISLDKNIVVAFLQEFDNLNNEILGLKDSFSPENIKKYSDDLSSIYMYISNCCIELQGFYNRICVFNVVSEPVIKNLKMNVRNLADKVDELITSAKRLKATSGSSTLVYSSTQKAETALKSTKNRNVIEVKLTGLLKNTQAALQFQKYLDIAKYTDLNDPLFIELTDGICELTDSVYNPEIQPMAPQVISYASIVGPSYMGKTQFAFSLARFCPVFYANFASPENIQDFYQAFSEISTIFIKCLSKDVKTLGKIGLNSGDILQKADGLKLRTIGFLWYLIEHSTGFRGFDQGAAPSDSEWFKHYLEKREVKYEKMSYRSYLQKKDLAEPKDEKNFKVPIVFIDEWNRKLEDEIMLLRNLCRIIGLRCILASSSAKVNNLLNVKKFGSSAWKANAIWVHAIRELPKANVKAIINSLGWGRFFNDLNEFDTAGLLNLYGFELDVSNRAQFDNLIKLMIQQSKSCLQGVSLIVFTALKEKMDLLKEANRASTASGLNISVQDIWKHILAVLWEHLLDRKPAAFQSFGPYHTLAMISDYRIISDNKGKKLDLSNRPIPSAEIVNQTIDSHFYYFGTKELPVMIPFGYNGRNLRYNRKKFTNCANFNLFKDDLFLCMALWKQVSDDDTTIASIVDQYMSTYNTRNQNPSALKNNSCAQECMAYWSLCNSTHTDIGSTIPGIEFLRRFINNIQTDYETPLVLPDKLQTFLFNIKIPYLLPKVISTSDIEAQLSDLCKFGNCERLANGVGYDIIFELLHHNNSKPRNGLVECKYIDDDLSALDAKEYIIKAKKRNYPFNMLVTYSMGHELKTLNYFESNRKQPSREPQPKKLKSDEGEGEANSAEDPELETEPIVKMAIYSVFYEGSQMKFVPLLEYDDDDPDGVFIIVQTNFKIPKI